MMIANDFDLRIITSNFAKIAYFAMQLMSFLKIVRFGFPIRLLCSCFTFDRYFSMLLFTTASLSYSRLIRYEYLRSQILCFKCIVIIARWANKMIV
jgi:hypothetical protein